LAKSLCEVELLWQFFKLKGGSNGELSFANVHKVTITIISVIKKHWQHVHHCGSVFGYGFLPKGIHFATQNNQQEAS
jgi:hypothetical protein